MGRRRLPCVWRAVRPACLLATLTTGCASTGEPPSSSLPLRQVVLYRNGLGYFERAGRLRSGHLSMQLRPGEVDDVMKTLAVSSRDGTAVSNSAASLKRLGEAGEMQLDLTVPADRDVRVSYAAPSPPWRSVYKLTLDEVGQASLETWAAVNNDSDQEWRDVHLTLAAAAPFSNTVDLQAARCADQPDATEAPARPPLHGFVAPERAGTDRDHDRIPDAIDACPDDPETYNGYQDEDGCPDRGHSGTGHSSEILDRIHFPRGTSEIAPVDKLLLDGIAAALKTYPGIDVIEVQGYVADDECRHSMLRESEVGPGCPRRPAGSEAGGAPSDRDELLVFRLREPLRARGRGRGASADRSEFNPI
jgi:outer membrane protein OmpA-like peptidoglycan-associated protein